MSDKTIRAGDLVMLIRGHSCTVNEFGGIPHVVQATNHSGSSNFRCPVCGADPVHRPSTYAEFGLCRAPLSWLIKIDPPAQPESIEHREEITA